MAATLTADVLEDQLALSVARVLASAGMGSRESQGRVEFSFARLCETLCGLCVKMFLFLISPQKDTSGSV